MANSLKHLLCFLLGAAAAVVCMLSYISMHEDGITEVAQASKIERQSREILQSPCFLKPINFLTSANNHYHQDAKVFLPPSCECEDISEYLHRRAFVEVFGRLVKVDGVSSTLARRTNESASWTIRKLSQSTFFISCPDFDIVHYLMAQGHIHGDGFSLTVNHWNPYRGVSQHRLKLKMNESSLMLDWSAIFSKNLRNAATLEQPFTEEEIREAVFNLLKDISRLNFTFVSLIPKEQDCRGQTTEHEDLRRVLRNATMNDRTVILTTLNEAWAKPNSVLDLFFESFRIGEQTEQLLNHLVILAMDPKAFERCKSVHPHCYFLTTEGVDFTAEKRFMSQDYLKMMWKRLEFFHVILELGYNFLFTDMDVMWLRNPFSHFSSNADITFSTDGFNGDPTDINNWPNNGFVYVRSCDQTIEFYKYWCFAKSLYPADNEQTVLNKIKHYNVARLNNRIRFLDTAYFSGFCQPSKDFNKVCTMHANCCIGIDNKLHDLRIVLADWKNYTSWTAEERERGGFSWRIPDKCNIKNLKRSTEKS
ncbi:uncharacterized protein At4g15970-like [Elaeis guineensis]|uniref:Uncharacterized protein At4g15970-like n=1 Tax=Elaeis guineensis var. tenera TaxID=51953 RepID=A0A6I9RHX4_ELAGV|nr:uncharacterized protein At4g15970-like [Elaeis guineensis]